MDRRKRRSSTPVQPRTPRSGSASQHGGGSSLRRSASSTPIDRVAMLVMEANEISLLLNKDYIFMKEGDTMTDELDTKVKVINTRLGMSCIWVLPKLKERLVRMRKLMYSSEVGITGDEVYFDASDSWVKDDAYRDYMAKNQSKPADVTAIQLDMNQSKPLSQSKVLDKMKSRSMDVIPSKSTDKNKSKRVDIFPIKPLKLLKSTSKKDKTVKPKELILHPEKLVKLGQSLTSTGSSELESDTQFLLALASPTSDTADPLPDKYLRGNSPPVRDVPNHKEDSKCHKDQDAVNLPPPGGSSGAPYQQNQVQSTQTSPTMLTLCKDMIQLTVRRMQGGVPSEERSLVDCMLCDCESIKLAVVTILDAYTTTQVAALSKAMFADSELVRVTSVQLVTALELLLTHSSLWSQSFNRIDSTLVQKMSTNVSKSVQQLSSELLAFIQGCENNDDNATDDCSSRILDYLYNLCHHCGELALATETNMCCLQDPDRSHLTLDNLMKFTEDDKENDLLKVKPSSDIKQAFLEGSNIFVQRTLTAGLQGVQDCQNKVQGWSRDAYAEMKSSRVTEELLKHVDMTLTTSRDLVLKFQQMQAELLKQMKGDGEKEKQFFQRYYEHGGRLVAHINNLRDSAALLTQAVEPLVAAPENGHGMKKVCRCTEILQKAAAKLIGGASVQNRSLGHSFVDSSLNRSMSSCLLSERQCDQLDAAGRELGIASDSLIEMAKKYIRPESCLGRAQRMLPVVPGEGKMPATRVQSAKIQRRRTIHRKVSSLDIPEETAQDIKTSSAQSEKKQATTKPSK